MQPFKPIVRFNNDRLGRDPVFTILSSNIAIHSCLLRRSAIANTRFPAALSFGEDKHFWMSMVLKGCRFFVIRKYYCTARIHPTNCSRHSFINEKQQQMALYQTLVQDKMLPGNKTKTYIYLKLIYVRHVLGLPLNIKEVAIALAAPGVIASELFQFVKRRWQLRWRFIRFYLNRKLTTQDME